jgi:hypothetical protein
MIAYKYFMPVIVKGSEAIDIIPDGFVVGMKNVGAVFMHINPFYILGIYVPAGMISPVYDQAAKPIIRHLPGKYRSEESGTYNQVIIFFY